jgi:hypothetical protein
MLCVGAVVLGVLMDKCLKHRYKLIFLNGYFIMSLCTFVFALNFPLPTLTKSVLRPTLASISALMMLHGFFGLR